MIQRFLIPSCCALLTPALVLLPYLLLLHVCAAGTLGQSVYAQEVRFVATPSANPVGVGEQFEVSFSANAQISKFRPPSFEGFVVVSGPNQATSVQYVNGVMSQTVSYSYILQAKSEGRFSIGNATAEAAGKPIQSQPITIQVVRSTTQSQQQRQQAAAAEESELTKQLQKNLYLKVSTNKTSVMRGEPFVATYKLYTRVSLVNYTARKAPALTGFWSQDIGDQQQLTFRDEMIGGQMFRVAVVKKVLLFPQQSGTLEIDPIEADVVARVQAQARRGGGSIFDQLFGGDPFGNFRDIKLSLKSAPVKITVRSLPQTNIPTEFVGAVGSNFHVDATLSQTVTKTNEPVKLKLRLSGKGNLKLIEPIRPIIPPDIESYDPTITDNVNVNESGAAGSKTFEYLLIPRYAGEYKLPPVTFAYYDLDQKRYISLSTPEFTLRVEKGKDDAPIIAGAKVVGKESVTALSTDIRFIKRPPEHLALRGEGFLWSRMFWGLLAAPPLLFFAFIVYRRKTEELRNNILLMRHRGATRIAKRRLRQAQKYLAAQDNTKFHDEIAKALWGYMSDKLSIPPAALTRQYVAQTLSERGVSNDVVQQFALTLDTCDFARFAPAKSEAMTHLYDDALALISHMERELK